MTTLTSVVNVSQQNQNFVSQVLESFAKKFGELRNKSDETARLVGKELASILHKSMAPGASVAITTNALTNSEYNSLQSDKKFPAELMSQSRLIEMADEFKTTLSGLNKKQRGEIAQNFVSKLIQTDSADPDKSTELKYYGTKVDYAEDQLGQGTSNSMIALYFKQEPVKQFVRSGTGLNAGDIVKAIVEYAVNTPDANLADALINFVKLQQGRYSLKE